MADSLPKPPSDTVDLKFNRWADTDLNRLSFAAFYVLERTDGNAVILTKTSEEVDTIAVGLERYGADGLTDMTPSQTSAVDRKVIINTVSQGRTVSRLVTSQAAAGNIDLAAWDHLVLTEPMDDFEKFALYASHASHSHVICMAENDAEDTQVDIRKHLKKTGRSGIYARFRDKYDTCDYRPTNTYGKDDLLFSKSPRNDPMLSSFINNHNRQVAAHGRRDEIPSYNVSPSDCAEMPLFISSAAMG